MSYYVYKHLDKNNDIIYIGQTKNINNRQREHKSHSKWFYKVCKIIYTELNDKLLTDIYEKLYIDTYSPIYNIKDIDCKYSRFFKNIEDLEFKEYVFENNNINLNDAFEKIIYFETNKNFELNDNFKNVLYEILAIFKHSDKIDVSKLKYKFLKQDFRILEYKLSNYFTEFRTYRELNENLELESYDFMLYKIVDGIYKSYKSKCNNLKVSDEILKCIQYIDIDKLLARIK